MAVVDIARELIAIPSVNPMGLPEREDETAERELTKYLISYFMDLRLPFEIQQVSPGRSNVLTMIKGKSSEDVILLDAHQDTVPVDNMTIDPFAGQVVGERLLGRGACDVKGGMAAILATLCNLLYERPYVTVVASFTCDEEHQQLGAAKLIESWDSPTPGKGLEYAKPRLAVITEPTDLNVVVAHRGVVRWTVTTEGQAAHSSKPEQGVNAIYRMAAVVRVLEEYAARLPQQVPAHPLCGTATLSVGVISGGASVNVVPDRCAIQIDRRLLPGESASSAQAEVSQLLADQLEFAVSCSEPWCLSDPLDDSQNGEVATALAEIAQEIAGKGQRMGVSYGTHAPQFAKAGVPTVVFGPGSIEQAHTKDEWIEIKQLDQAAEILTELCLRS